MTTDLILWTFVAVAFAPLLIAIKLTNDYLRAGN